MKTLINAVKAGCNTCDNGKCNADVEPCKGHKAYPKKGFSLLELAVRKSASSVNDLLGMAKLQFIPANNERGFHLSK